MTFTKSSIVVDTSLETNLINLSLNKPKFIYLYIYIYNKK